MPPQVNQADTELELVRIVSLRRRTLKQLHNFRRDLVFLREIMAVSGAL
jgi:hypothetical protein